MIATTIYQSPSSRNCYYLCEHHGRIAATKGWALAGKPETDEDECEACDTFANAPAWIKTLRGPVVT